MPRLPFAGPFEEVHHTPSVPACSLSAKFQCSDTNLEVPPVFYPGQAIPTVLTFKLNRNSSLPHSLNPSLTMSLLGTLHIPNARPRTIISVSVSLSEGIELWSRDAQQAYAVNPPPDLLVDPKTCLPGGTYSLPLTVQVPCTPRLPPSFTIWGASFAVTYALAVTLSCDDPNREGAKLVLAETSKGFEMMPHTKPTRAPTYNPQSFYVRTDGLSSGGAVGMKGLVRRSNSRWTVEPSLPTTAFSPTSVIPIHLRLTPPPDVDARVQLVVRVALMRREYSSMYDAEIRDSTGQAGLVSEHEIASRFAWYNPTCTAPLEISAILPLMQDGTWTHGFSTSLNVGPSDKTPETEHIFVSSTFHLNITLAFLPLTPDSISLVKLLGRPLPPVGVFSDVHDVLDLPSLKRNFPGTIHSVPLPIVVGSVSEPRNAMQNYRWSDLYIDRSNGRERARMVSGEAITCEDGWVLPPPEYEEAIKEVPYEY